MSLYMENLCDVTLSSAKLRQPLSIQLIDNENNFAATV